VCCDRQWTSNRANAKASASFALTIDRHRDQGLRFNHYIRIISIKIPMSSITSSNSGQEGLTNRLREVFRKALRFLSCKAPYVRSTHPYMENGAVLQQPSRPRLPQPVTYCGLPQGIRRQPARAPEHQGDSLEHAESV
jgi:hypothetical protein